MNKRSLLLPIFACLALFGCNESPPAPADRSAVRTPEGGVLRMMQLAPSNLDPARMLDTYQASIINQVYEGLLRYDNNFNVLPSLAESWRIGRDGTTYDFVLSPKVRFHDGEFLDADDVAFSLTRVFDLDPSEAQLAQQYLGVIAGARAYQQGRAEQVEGIEVLDPLHLRIRLERPYASFLNVLASEMARVVPRDYVERVGAEELGRHPIGCGPFRFDSWKEGRIVLRRFEAYHGPKARLDRLVYEVRDDLVLEKTLRAFRDGRIDAVELTTGGLDVLERVPGAAHHRRQELSLTYIGLNLRRPPFDDVRVRRALAHAIDRSSLSGIDPDTRPGATGILPPGFPGYSPEPRRLPYEPETARALLAQVSGGRRVPFELALLRRSQNVEAMIDDLCDQLRAVGFQPEITWLDSWDAFDTGLKVDAYGAFLLTWVADLPDPDSFFFPLFHSTGSVNYQHYDNAAVDRLLEQARSGVTEGRRIDAYRDAEHLILSEAPIVPLHFTTAYFAVQPYVRDFELSSMGMGNIAMWKVWIDDPARRADSREEVAR